MRRRQIGLRARNKLAQLSPNSRGILANVARLPGSLNFSSILLSLPHPSSTVLLQKVRRRSSELFPGRNDRWKNHESVSLNPILTELEIGAAVETVSKHIRACTHVPPPPPLPGGKRVSREHARASTWRSLCVHRADWSSFLTFPWLLPVPSFTSSSFSFFFFKGFFLVF